MPVLPQHLHVDPRLVVEALQKPAGGELHEVPVTLGGPGDEREMIVRGAAAIVPVGRDVDLATHQGLYAGVFGLLVELDRAVHHTVVRESEPWHPLIFGKRDEVPYTTRPVEHRILRVTVQVRESAARRNRQPSSLCSRVSATPRKRAPPAACSPRQYPTRATIRQGPTGCPEYLDHKLRHVLQDFSFRFQVTGFRYQVRVLGA